MKLAWKVKGLAAVLASMGLLGTGCSGINQTIGVSPATFLLPGLIQSVPPSTNDMLVPQVSPITIAQAQ